jgi:hypothetical protein
MFFKMTARRNGRAVVSVKAGNDAHPDKVRELIGTRVSEGADAAIFVCVGKVTADMERAAAADKVFETPFGVFPRCQIISVERLFERKPVDLPLILQAASITEEAKVTKKKARAPKRPTAEELRREPQMRFPIKGGRAKDQQAPLPLSEPLLVPQQAKTPGKKRRAN